MFFFIFKFYSNFPHIFQQLHISNTILPLSKSPRNTILIIFTLYHLFPLISFIKKCNYFYNITFVHFVDSLVPHLIVSIQLSIDLQFFNFLYALFLLFQEINHILKNILVIPISQRRIDELRFAYGILHELCEYINNIYGITIIISLCYTNVSIQYLTFEYIKMIFSVIYNMNVNWLDVRITLRTLSMLSRIFLLFWSCNRLESEVSNMIIISNVIYE
jgi:hypothetical protein